MCCSSYCFNHTVKMGCIEFISNIIFQYIVHHMMSLIFNHALRLHSRLDVHFKHTKTPQIALMEYIHLKKHHLAWTLFVSNKIEPFLGWARAEIIRGRSALSVIFLLSIFRCSKLFRNASCSSVFVRLCCLSHFVFHQG